MGDRARTTLIDDLRADLQAGNAAAVMKRLGALRTEVRRGALDALDDPERAALLALLPVEHGGDLLALLEPRAAAAGLERLNLSRAGQLLDAMDVDHAVPILEELPTGLAANIVADMATTDATTLMQAYAEGTAGRLMTPRPFAVSESHSAGEALQALRTASRDPGAITYLYVVDAAQHLVGVAGLRDAIVAAPDTSIRDVMTPFPVSVHESTREEDVVRLFHLYRLLGLPVIDDAARLVGVIRAERLLDQSAEEAGDDLLGVFGVMEARRSETLLDTMRHRLPWLTANMLTAFLGAAVVGAFAGTLESLVTLAIFLPVVAGMGGNAGGQTVAVLVRMLAMQELGDGAGRRALRHELAAATLHGVMFGLVVGAVAGLVMQAPLLGLAVGAAMWGVLVAAGAAGTLIPLGLRAVGLDPAIGSTVLLTTVTDVVGFGFLLGFSALVLTTIG